MQNILGLVFIGLIIYFYYNKQNKITLLREEYQNALRGTDKKLALEAGRSYYAALRGKDVLTIMDEQAISNDLTAMDDARRNS